MVVPGHIGLTACSKSLYTSPRKGEVAGSIGTGERYLVIARSHAKNGVVWLFIVYASGMYWIRVHPSDA